MPWNLENPPAAERADFVELVLSGDCSISRACRDFGISRKTAYKWIGRATQERPQPLRDRSRRPHRQPARTPPEIERAILEVHEEYRWGARKVYAFLCQRGQAVPSPGTVQKVLRRHGRVTAAAPPRPPHRFERAVPNQLWQVDFKGPLAGASPPRYLLTVEDDHSRMLLAVRLLGDQTMASAWEVFWPLWGRIGLPVALLTDNGFAPRGPARHGLSWLEARLLRLGIRSLHGRPYHPQTQGKVERAHRTMERELLPRLDWGEPEPRVAERVERWREVYNTARPHEALGHATPASRWYASERPRPELLPAMTYPPGTPTRQVLSHGEISWRGYGVSVGLGLQGESVAVEEVPGEAILIRYGTHLIRRVEIDSLRRGRVV